MSRAKRRQRPIPDRPLTVRLRLDRNLAAFLRALVRSKAAIFGNEEQTARYALRTLLIDLTKAGSGFRAPIVENLPPRLRKHWPLP